MTSVKTEEQAIKSLDIYDGIYYSLVVCQFKFSRQQGKGVEDSLKDVHNRILEVTTSVIERHDAL